MITSFLKWAMSATAYTCGESMCILKRVKQIAAMCTTAAYHNEITKGSVRYAWQPEKQYLWVCSIFFGPFIHVVPLTRVCQPARASPCLLESWYVFDCQRLKGKVKGNPILFADPAPKFEKFPKLFW